MTIIFVGFKLLLQQSVKSAGFLVFFACWACPFRHPKRNRGKDDVFFFHFYPLALWHSLNRPFVLRQKARERLTDKKWVDGHGGKQSWDILIWSFLLSATCFPAHPFWKPSALSSICAHNTPREDRGPPTPPWSHMNTQPETSSPCFPLVQCLQEHSAFQVTLNPCWALRGQDFGEKGLFLKKKKQNI